MQKPIVEIKKTYLFGLFAILLWAPLPWIYFNPPQFLQGQPLSVYAIVLFLAGMSSAALTVFFVLKRRMSSTAARIYSILFLLTGISAYQLSGFAPSWSCFGKQIYVATANAAGQTCTTTCTDNDRKPCSGWSSCWDKFVSCNSAGKDQGGRNCSGCCFACDVVCEPDPEPQNQPPTISSSISCSQPGANGWCVGTEVLTLTASDPQGYTLTITGDIGGTAFTCPVGNACFQPVPQGAGSINYAVTAAESGLSATGSTAWALDATPPSVNGTLSGTAGANGWYLGSVTYNGAASDSLSGLASLTCTLDGAPPGSCNSITVSSEGVHTLAFTARDNAGNTQAFNQTISIDLQNPALNSSLSGTLGSNNWYTDASLHASASDAAPGSGLWAVEYNLDGGSWTGFPASGSLDVPEGQHTIGVRAVDLAGRVTTGTKSYSLDRELPNVTVTPTGTLGLQNWYITPLTVGASASDTTSGMDIFEYSLNNGSWTTYSAPLTLNDGTHSLSFWAQDLAGLVKQVDERYKVDTRAPQISGNLSGVLGANGWYISPVTISASAADPAPGSGVDTLTYILNGGVGTPYANPLTLSEGQHTIQFNAQDIAGLTDSRTQTIKVDTTKPSLNIATTLPAWNMGLIRINGTASDSGSGLSKVELSIDGITWQTITGTTTWSYEWDTTKGPNGRYQVHVRATDQASLTNEQILEVGVDHGGPRIELPESWFQWDIVTLDVWDNHSGLSEVRVEISDPEERWEPRKIKLDPNGFPMDFKWDRRFGDGTVAPLGMYRVKVMAFDHMGNMTRVGATIKILLGILPAGPTATPQPYTRFDPTPTNLSTPASLATFTATAMPFTSGFGSRPESSVQATPTIAASPRATPTKTTVLDWIESIFVPNTTEETVTDVGTPEADPSIFWGATLAAVAGAVTAYNLAEQRKREEQAAREADEERRARRKAQKMKKLEAQWAQEKAWEEARKKEEQREQQIVSNARMEAKMARIDAEDEAKWTASQAVIQKREEEKKRATEEERIKLEKQYTGLATYRDSEKHSESPVVVTATEKPWWEKTLDWIDNHQTETSMAIGAGVGLLAIGIVLALPAVVVSLPVVLAAAAVSAVVAGVGIGAGTIALNNYYDRDYMTNVWSNVKAGAATAAIVSGVGLLFAGGLATQAVTAIGNTVGAWCRSNQSVCMRVEPAMNALDTAEEAWLSTKLAVQTWRGDTAGAAETALELQTEYLDGGMPGNAVAEELGGETLEVVAKYGDEAIELVQLYGPDAAQIIFSYGEDGIAALQKHGKQGIELIKDHGGVAIRVLGAVNLEAAQKLLKTLDDNDLYSAIKQGPEVVRALSAWSDSDLLQHGAELAARAKKDAEVLAKVKELVDLGPIDPKKLTDEQKALIKFIAENSTFYGDEMQIVLGKWDNFSGGFLEYARKTDSMHYGPHPDMYNLLEGLENQNDVAWLVNQSVIQTGIDSGKPFEYSLNGVKPENIELEEDAIKKIWEGAPDTEIMYANIKEALDIDYVPVRMMELVELHKAGYMYSYDAVTNSYILIKP